MNHVIAIVGMCGSGKSVVSDVLVAKGYTYLRFGQITLDTIKERGLSISEENEKMIREGFRKEHGMGAYATLNLANIDAFLQEGNVVADGLYSWAEYKILKNHYGEQLIVVAVYAPPYLRYQRLEARTLIDAAMRNRPIPSEKAKMRDYAEIENIEKGGPIVMADYTILNIGNLEELQRETENLLQHI